VKDRAVDLTARGMSWVEFDRDEWVRGSWRARCLTEANGWDSSYSDGRLILTNERVLFASDVPGEKLLALRFDDRLAIQCKRYRFSLHQLIIETSSGQRFAFRTIKLACKQIEVRSQMRRLAKR
jgi:hypothetical protein